MSVAPLLIKQTKVKKQTASQSSAVLVFHNLHKLFDNFNFNVHFGLNGYVRPYRFARTVGLLTP
eukprot:2686537-Amphidinium_carterae.2